MNTQKFFIYLAVMALVTYLIRVIPLVAIRKKISNKFLNSFLAYIPYTVLGAMTFPAILFSTNSLPSALLASFAAVAMAFLGRSLIQVAVFACCTALVVGVIELYFNSFLHH